MTNLKNMTFLRMLGAGLALVMLLAPGLAISQQADQEVEALEGVGVEEHLGDPIPLVLPFNDENGQRVQLGDYFDGKRPVILTLNYFKCPMLCGLMLNGVADTLSMLNWTPGEEFEVVTVSINPLEKPPLALQNKQGYVKKSGKPEVAQGWHYLTGDQDEITALAEAVGFKYRLDPETQQFLHQAAIFVITPDGRISRYLYGVQYPVNDVKLALTEAADGKIGSTTERIFLACFAYDPASGSYTLQAMAIMRIAGVLTLVVLVLMLVTFWVRDAARRAKQNAGNNETAAEGKS